MKYRKSVTRLPRLIAVLAIAGSLSACEGLLDVEDPSAIEGHELDDPALVEFLVNGVRGSFQSMFISHVYNVGIFSDELIGGHMSVSQPLWDRRDIDANHSTNSSLYSSVHAARGAADSLAARIESVLGDDASTSLGLAEVLAFGGYSYIIIAEHFCTSPINMSAPFTPAELFEMAVDRFDRAIAIATAAKAAGASAASADVIVNTARVGAARAYLGRGDNSQAITYASQVPAEFEVFANYTDIPTATGNSFFLFTSTLDYRAALEPPLDTANDPRVPAGPVRQRLPDGRMMFPPYVPFSWSGWNATDPQVITESNDIRFASGLEARYIVAEAGGMSTVELRQFIDARRTVGAQGAFTGTDAELIVELREQRRRDLFLTAHRLGDLRRYKAQGIDLFPRGAAPGLQGAVYADVECLLIPQSELTSNPLAHN